MMQKLFIDKKFKYDGSQLRPLYAYENFKILGDSIVSWIGPCDVAFDHMIDVEDKIENAKICGDLMLHFIIEFFGPDLTAGVTVQRLMASIIKDNIQDMTDYKFKLFRQGDDIYLFNESGHQKLSISIASRSSVSTMIHFAVNIINDGTPVKTTSLTDLGLKANDFAIKIMNDFSKEYDSIVIATKKVIPL